MDDHAFSEIRDMLDQGIAIKKTREQVNQGFRDVADAFNFFPNASKVSSDFQYTHELLFRTMATLVPPAPSVLDLGAGTGRLSKNLPQAYNRSTCAVAHWRHGLQQSASQVRNPRERYTQTGFAS